jgi:hypothetical protein
MLTVYACLIRPFLTTHSLLILLPLQVRFLHLLILLLLLLPPQLAVKLLLGANTVGGRPPLLQLGYLALIVVDTVRVSLL